MHLHIHCTHVLLKHKKNVLKHVGKSALQPIKLCVVINATVVININVNNYNKYGSI